MSEREGRAFALAPLPWLVPLLLAVGINAVAGDTENGGFPAIFFVMVIFAVLSYVATLLFGVLIHIVLNHFQKTGLIYYVGLAVLPFALFAVAIAVWLLLDPATAVVIDKHFNPHSIYMNRGVTIKW